MSGILTPLNPSPEETYIGLKEQWIPEALKNVDDSNGMNSIFAKGELCTRYRKLAVLEWHLYKRADKFHEYMKTSVQYEEKVCRQRKEIYPPHFHYTSTVNLDSMYDSLNTGDEAFARSYITFVDDNYDYHEKPSSHPAHWWYSCLMALTIGRHEKDFPMFLEKLHKATATKKHGRMQPLTYMLQAIWENNEDLLNDSAWAYTKVHKSLCRGYFDGYVDKFLCRWGLGACNLAVMKGMRVTVDHPFLPQALIGL